MMQRCTNPKNKDYARYGGRGIEVVERWQEFVNFQADMSETFVDGLEIDRVDNDGNYEHGNCRWTTNKVNARNQEKTVMVEWDGISLPLCELAERFGHTYKRVYQRHVTYRWSLERAIRTPA